MENRAPHRICFVICEDFSLLGYALAKEMFRFANQALGRDFYRSDTIARSAAPVTCSNGASLLPTGPVSGSGQADTIFVSSGAYHRYPDFERVLIAWLRAQYRKGARVGALGSGIWVLARSGLLDRRSCAPHWLEAPALQEEFPKLRTVTEPFAFDGRVFSCPGGDSVTDMVLSLLSDSHGAALSDQVRSMILLKPATLARSQRSLLLRDLGSAKARKLSQVLDRMESTISAPLSIPDLCRACNLHPRTLSRYTNKLFGCSPGSLFLRLRLEHARFLLSHSQMSIAAIADTCGFNTPSRFSTAFLAHAGRSPGHLRRPISGTRRRPD